MIKIFGDSFSNYHLPKNKNLHWYSKLSKKINLPYTNFADGGCTNKEILFSLIYNIQDFGKDDIVICNLTHTKRMSISPGSSEVIFENEVILDGKQCFDINTKAKKTLSESEWTIVKNYFNKFFVPNEIEKPGYINEIEHLLNYISKSVKLVIIWDWLNIYEVDKFTLSESDKHLNIDGHEFVYNNFYNKILNYNSPSKKVFFENFS